MIYKSPQGNPLDIDDHRFKRIIPVGEVRDSEYYSDMADLAEIFGHNVVEMDDGIWRWQANRLISWLMDHAPVTTPSQLEIAADNPGNILVDGFSLPARHTIRGKDVRGSICLNQMIRDLTRGMFSMEEWMKFYMQMGYSLSGYAEVFGQHEASEYKLQGALTEPVDKDGYAETVIDYMIRLHKGKTLWI